MPDPDRGDRCTQGTWNKGNERRFMGILHDWTALLGNGHDPIGLKRCIAFSETVTSLELF